MKRNFTCPLMPDFVLPDYRAISPEKCRDAGIRAILCDIDNTLAPYEQYAPDGDMIDWTRRLADCGIGIALISNNSRDRVERFGTALGVPFFWKSRKPIGKAIKAAMNALGSDKHSTLMLGDQLLTDAAAGAIYGIPSVIVPPINDKKNLFFRFKRLCERPFLARYRKKIGKVPLGPDAIS